ncbi:MAG: cyclic nucleotide-binding domain-containing protein [Shimia sp.]
MDIALLWEVAGLFGVASYVVAYALLQTGAIPGNTYTYPGMNLVGASLVGVSLLNAFNAWSALVSIFFVLFSLIGLWRVWRRRRALRFTEAEQAMIDARLGALHRADIRAFLDAGTWEDAAPGQVLTEEGRPVAALAYIAEGTVEVVVGGRPVARVEAGEFVGEMGVLTRADATATTRAVGRLRLFRIGHGALADLIRRDRDLRPQLEFVLADDTRAKLKAANARLAAASGPAEVQAATA